MDDGSAKRSRGRGRGSKPRGRGRGSKTRGRGRGGRKATRIIESDEDVTKDEDEDSEIISIDIKPPSPEAIPVEPVQDEKENEEIQQPPTSKPVCSWKLTTITIT